MLTCTVWEIAFSINRGVQLLWCHRLKSEQYKRTTHGGMYRIWCHGIATGFQRFYFHIQLCIYTIHVHILQITFRRDTLMFYIIQTFKRLTFESSCSLCVWVGSVLFTILYHFDVITHAWQRTFRRQLRQFKAVSHLVQSEQNFILWRKKQKDTFIKYNNQVIVPHASTFPELRYVEVQGVPNLWGEGYRNWPRYVLRCCGLCCHSQHSMSGAGRLWSLQLR